jgi:hypothetical protein|tara:strand:- start:2013 stop:2354 length:342 start_codon:yes stop_codon:yes gene_type:complete
MNWFQLANLNSIFEQAGETDLLRTLRKIKDMTIQTQRGARGMIIDLRKNYEDDNEICNLFDKASFYSPDSPKKVKILIDSVISQIASKIIKEKMEKEKNGGKDGFTIVKGLVS